MQHFGLGLKNKIKKNSNKQKVRGDIMSGIEPDDGSWKKWTRVGVQEAFSATALLLLLHFQRKKLKIKKKKM